MTPEEFVTQLRSAVVEENTAIYRDLFSNTFVNKASDPYWKRALGLFGALTPEQREVFFEILRQVAVDTTSNILGILDGVSALKSVGRFELRTGGQDLGNDLQSLFLAEEEEQSAP